MKERINPASEAGISLARSRERSAKAAPHAGGPAVRQALERRDVNEARAEIEEAFVDVGQAFNEAGRSLDTVIGQPQEGG